MKKFYLGALGFLLAMGASAQSFDPVGTVTIEDGLDGGAGLIQSIPHEFAFQDKSTPYSFGTFDEDGVKFDVYNKSFGIDRTIKVTAPTSYTRTEIELREVAFSGTEKTIDCSEYIELGDNMGYQGYRDYSAEYYGSGNALFTEECITQYINRAGEGGFVFGLNEVEVRWYYVDSIAISSPGETYFYTELGGWFDDNVQPELYFVWKDESIIAHYTEYTTSYTGEWVKTIERYDYEEDDFLYDMVMHPVLIGQWDDIDDGFGDDGFTATQTLFNNDDKWEFIRPIYKEVIYEDYYYDSEQDRDGDGEIDYKRTRYGDQVVGYEIVSEDGNVLTTLTIEENDDCVLAILMWDEDVYLATIIEKKVESDDEEDYYDRYETYMVLYTIDKNTTNISKINATAPAMRVSPALANRNSTINVTLDGEAATRGGELIITDSNGRTIGRNRVDAGQKSVTMSTDRMSTGAYNITLTEKGKKIDNARIIVK